MDIKLNRGMPGMPPIPTQLPTLLLLLGAGVFLVIGAVLALTGLRAKKMLG